MDKFDRIQQLHRIFKCNRRPVPLTDLSKELECSAQTVKRSIESMRDHLNAPIEFSRADHGYRYFPSDQDYELPGLWMTGQELQSLVVIAQAIHSIDEGLLTKEFDIFEKQVEKLMRARGIELTSVSSKIKWLPLEKHFTKAEVFTKASEALLSGVRMNLSYTDYSQNKTNREISPQQLIYYRENWYLDAWCHLRKELRSFMLARMSKVELNKKKSKEVLHANLINHYAQSYGIFSGEAKHEAKLIFSPPVSYEVANQQWHPDQKSWWEGDKYLLSFPFNKDNELVRDILKFGGLVEVQAPPVLRDKIKELAGSVLALYK
ncbi:YafY family protein [Oceanicoccus sp. KOV_DT_Chl]|uniref:helix-turn-helix transcriptional regulator n=1 Tax=Oceanicoccus sp. KOV_DT_Chl TaxID=1904639 RepID=UPI000C79B148|nr:WYL domain-containing protein [Oceanicoccus sp. KOV_DT_Chl]